MHPLLALKLKRQILAANPALDVQLKNVAVNGEKMGCSGFVTDPGTGRIIYISTDHNHGTSRQALFRAARHDRDYHGGHNHFTKHADLAQDVVELLKSSHFDRELTGR